MPEPTLREVLARQVKMLRKRRGLTARELAATVGVTRNYIFDIESVRYSPSLRVIQRIADILLVPLISLLVTDTVPRLCAYGLMCQQPEALIDWLADADAWRYVSLAQRLALAGIPAEDAEVFIAAAETVAGRHGPKV